MPDSHRFTLTALNTNYNFRNCRMVFSRIPIFYHKCTQSKITLYLIICRSEFEFDT